MGAGTTAPLLSMPKDDTKRREQLRGYSSEELVKRVLDLEDRLALIRSTFSLPSAWNRKPELVDVAHVLTAFYSAMERRGYYVDSATFRAKNEPVAKDLLSQFPLHRILAFIEWFFRTKEALPFWKKVAPNNLGTIRTAMNDFVACHPAPEGAQSSSLVDYNAVGGRREQHEHHDAGPAIPDRP